MAQERKLNIGLIVGGVVAFLTVLGFFLTWLLFMHTEVAEPGQELVIVDKPYFFGHEGVRAETVKEGRVLLFRTSTVVPVRMTPSAVVVRFDDLSSADNILLDFESTIQFQFTNSVSLVKNFGAEGWFENNIERQFMAIVRDAVKKKTMTQMMSDVEAASAVDKEVTDALQKLVVDAKLPLRILGVSLGRAQPNENVLAQMNETAAQQQRKKTLIEAEAAEIQRKKEQIAKADADNAYRNSIGLSPEQFIQLEQIKRYSETCAKSTCIIGSVPVVVGGK
jgi:regulator of protease activity HflC (stomatin/prohibitin superfamily)